MNKKNTISLTETAKLVRQSILEMISGSGSSHIAPAYSIVDILVALYFSVLNIDPKNPAWEKRDRFLLSKGHAGAALYAVLAHRGFVGLDALKNFAQAKSAMAGHAVRNSIPGVEITSGSLGHGLPIGLGMAMALKKSAPQARVFVLVGDGECNEGSIWEAALVAGHFKLDNLVVIVDKNGQQGLGSSKKIMNMNPFAEKWKAFGWQIKECDGHNFIELSESLSSKSKVKGKPTVVIAVTIKGKGVSYMEAGPLSWHYKTPKEQFLIQAKKELESNA